MRHALTTSCCATALLCALASSARAQTPGADSADARPDNMWHASARMGSLALGTPQQLSASVLLGARSHSGVLIAGAGHARNDRGVPFALHAQEPGARVASVAFVEVEHGTRSPGAYAARFGSKTLPFDYVWFTPRLDDDDPCEKFKKKP